MPTFIGVCCALSVGCSSKDKAPDDAAPAQTFAESKTSSGESVEIQTPSAATGPSKGTETQTGQASRTGKVVHLNTPDAEGDLMVYSGRSKSIMTPLLDTFEKTTGIKVSVVYNKKTIALAERIAQEGKNTEADVFLGQDAGYIGALAKQGHLIQLPQPLLDLVASDHRDPNGFWIGTSGRARVLVYNPSSVKKEDLPSSLEGLADPRWAKRVGWAPSNASFQAHVSTLRKVWGEDKTKAWLTKMRGIQPQKYPKNSPQVKGVANGEIDIGWVNHYYLHRARATNPDIKAENYFFPEVGGAGNLLMLSGIGITKHSKRKAKALKLVSFLLSHEAQTHFAQKVFEYPTIADVKLHPNVPPIPPGALAGDKAALADVQGTVRMLRDLGLL